MLAFVKKCRMLTGDAILKDADCYWISFWRIIQRNNLSGSLRSETIIYRRAAVSRCKWYKRKFIIRALLSEATFTGFGSSSALCSVKLLLQVSF